MISPDQYLRNILAREAPPNRLFTLLNLCSANLFPVLREWAGQQLMDISPSGSFAKGTANNSGTDMDIFVSLSPDTSETLKEIYNKLHVCLSKKGTVAVT